MPRILLPNSFLRAPANVVPVRAINRPGGPNATANAQAPVNPTTLAQHAAVQQKRGMRIKSTLVPELAQAGATPLDSRPVIITPNPFPAYPAPGAAAIDVISYLVPAGMFFVIQLMAIVHVGGGFIDGSGNVVWRLKINKAGVKGLSNLTAQVGSWAQPVPIQFSAKENDLIEITVEVPAGQPAMPVGDTTAARMHGYLLPISRSQQELT